MQCIRCQLWFSFHGETAASSGLILDEVKQSSIRRTAANGAYGEHWTLMRFPTHKSDPFLGPIDATHHDRHLRQHRNKTEGATYLILPSA